VAARRTIRTSGCDFSASSSAELALEEGDVIYIYPVEVTEYYLIVPEEDAGTPLG
jgi:hypothetical protein